MKLTFLLLVRRLVIPPCDFIACYLIGQKENSSGYFQYLEKKKKVSFLRSCGRLGSLISTTGHILMKFDVVIPLERGPGSVVGIATAYGLDGPGIESRWGGGVRFSAPVQTGSEARPASCKMGTGSFPGVRCGRGVTLTPHPF